MSGPRSSSTPELAAQGIEDEQSQLHRLELASMIEATNLIILVGIAVPLKYWYGLPQITKIMGPLHGLAFLYYCWTVIQTVSAGGWRKAEVLRLITVAFIPIAGFLNIAWIRQRRTELAQPESCQ